MPHYPLSFLAELTELEMVVSSIGWGLLDGRVFSVCLRFAHHFIGYPAHWYLSYDHISTSSLSYPFVCRYTIPYLHHTRPTTTFLRVDLLVDSW
jgi:hypothetical protein